MTKPEQLELMDVKPVPQEKLPKRRMGILGENLREFIKETKTEHVCAACGKMIEKGSRAVKLAPLIHGKPDLSKIEYFHPVGACPE